MDPILAVERGGFKVTSVLLNGIGAVMVLILIIFDIAA